MDSKRHLPAARRMTSWKVAVLCGIAGLTAATWPAPGPAGLNRVAPLTVSAAGMSEGIAAESTTRSRHRIVSYIRHQTKDKTP